MEKNGEPLAVHDVLSVFTSEQDSGGNGASHIVIQLLTAEGLLVLKTTRAIAHDLAQALARASQQGNAGWTPDYRSSATAEEAR